MDYYHNTITDKSWRVLCSLKANYEFILIGGWAVYLYTKVLKSKDIDMVADFDCLEKLKQDYQVDKNHRLKKYEARAQEVEIDIYVPYYSNPGIQAEDLGNYVTTVEGFKVVSKEVLAVLKEKALSVRADSPKGRKDLIDLISLFSLPDFDWKEYKRILNEYGLVDLAEFAKKTVAETRQIEELDFNLHKMAGFKRKTFGLIG